MRSSAFNACCGVKATSPRSSSRSADHRLESLTRDYRELVDYSHPDNLLLHHFSLGSKASRTAFAVPDRMAIIYHNITPPEYFVGVHRTLARQCFRGRRELRAYADRCDLALGDSEFNRAGSRTARVSRAPRCCRSFRISRTSIGGRTGWSPISSTTRGPT